MSGLRFYLLLAAFCSCSFLGRGDDVLPKTELLDVPPAPKVEGLGVSEAVLPASKVEDTVTDATEVDVDKKKNTTTSTTTTTTTTTTTPAPTPAPLPPTPPPPPQPLPAPDQGTWLYTDPATNITCIMAQFAAQINITYTMTVKNVTSLHTVAMNVPANATVADGSCNATATEQWLVMIWPSDASDANATVFNAIRLQFLKNETTKNYALNSFNLTVDASMLVNASIPVETLDFSHGEEWATPLATSYRCTPATKLSMSNETYDATAVVTVSRLQEEAFKTTPGKGFSAARECGGGDVPDAVPIAVGCALGGLVLVVLIAYLVARRRSAARGYLSM